MLPVYDRVAAYVFPEHLITYAERLLKKGEVNRRLQERIFPPIPLNRQT